MAKFSREQALRERRARKQEKKDSRKQAAVGLGTELEVADTLPAGAAEGDVPVA